MVNYIWVDVCSLPESLWLLSNGAEVSRKVCRLKIVFFFYSIVVSIRKCKLLYVLIPITKSTTNSIFILTSIFFGIIWISEIFNFSTLEILSKQGYKGFLTMHFHCHNYHTFPVKWPRAQTDFRNNIPTARLGLQIIASIALYAVCKLHFGDARFSVYSGNDAAARYRMFSHRIGRY